MYQILVFLTKAPHLSTAEFIDYYENKHVPLVTSLCGAEAMPLVYKRRYTHRDDPMHTWLTPTVNGDEAVDFDAVTELVFENQEGAKAWVAAWGKGDGAKRVAEDEAMFLVRARTRAQIVEAFGG